MAVTRLKGFTTNQAAWHTAPIQGDAAHPIADRPNNRRAVVTDRHLSRPVPGGPSTHWDRPQAIPVAPPSGYDARPPPPLACPRRPQVPPSPCPMHGVPAVRRQDDCP